MSDKKNVIIIIVDAFRTKNTSLYGYDKVTDKSLSKIAAESLVFKDFFSSSNATAPSLTSIFTGKYPNNHGIVHQFPYTTEEEFAKLEENKFWLPSFLKSKGYETIAIDWIGLFFKEGFDYYEEKDDRKSNMEKLMEINVVKKFLLGLPNWAYKLGKSVTKARTSAKFSPAEDTMDLGIRKIKESKKPFFLFMHFWDTHFPFPTTPFDGSGKNDINEFLNKIEDKNQKEYFKKRVTDIGLNSVDEMIDKYDKSIEMVDEQIGKLVDFLKKEKLWDDTVLIVLGDHGTNLIDHKVYFSSSSLFDDTIHVPYVMHLPGYQGMKVEGFAQNIDIAPTLLDYLRFSNDSQMDGESLLKLVRGEKIRERVLFFDGLAGDIKGVRTKDRKLIVAKDNNCNLCKSNHHQWFEEYDLTKDSEEKENIFNGNSELMKFLDNRQDINKASEMAYLQY
ncbi:hypothetical protein CMI42_06415 [Candidatus Pacearchaeota archaeon]|nr:hypothetical protein [Candidatus Pacearchaeota archaeon]|tara:strand:- start:894 stop:2234 length:1341 start_codon:yes stop_codon:yes gene_type:complete